MTDGRFYEVDPARVAAEVVDPHAFDSQVGKIVDVRVGDEVVGRARLAGAVLDGEGWVFVLETLRPGEGTTVALRTSMPMAVQPAEPEPEPEPPHVHRWRGVEVDGNDYRTVLVADPRQPVQQPGLVCEGGPGSCPVIDDPERGAWAGLPLNIVLEGDPRE